MMSGMDLRELLLIETYVSGGNIRDNDVGYEGAQGALVISNDGNAILSVTKPRYVIIPVFEKSDSEASALVDALLWAAAYNKDSVAGCAPGQLVESLRGQLENGELVKLYAKPGTPAWNRAMAEKGDLPLIEALGQWGEWTMGPNVVLGLPHQENLGVSLQPGGGLQGLCIFPRFVAAAWVVG